MGMKGRREKSQQTNKSLSVSGVMGWTKGGGREAHQAVVDLLVCWLVGADTGYSCWFKKRGTDEQCT